MIIKEMRASFGMLKGSALSLSPGLNVICGPNESGKSTWASFILTMLFGLDTSDKDKTGYIALKNLYAPHSGELMQGLMSLETRQGGVTIERFTARAGAPMKGFRAYFTDTGAPADALTAMNAGEYLTGAGRETYERTAYIGRSGMRVGQSAELERRIMSMLSSGSEESSYTEAEARLRAWQNKISRANTGEISKLGTKLSDARARLNKLNELSGRETELVLRTESFAGRAKELKEALDRLDAYERYKKSQAIEQAREEAGELKKQAGLLEESLTFNGAVLQNTQILKLRGLLERLKAAEDGLKKADSALDDAKRQKEQAQEACEKFTAFSSMDEKAAWEQASKDAEEIRREKENNRRTPLLKYLAAPALSLILAVAAFAAGLNAFALALAALFAAASAACLVLYNKKRHARPSQDLFFKRYGVSEPQEVLDLAAAYREARARLSLKEEALKSLIEDKSVLENELFKINGEMLKLKAFILPDVEREEDINGELDRLEGELAKLDGLKAKAYTAKVRYETLLSGSSLPESPAPAAEEPEGVDRESARCELNEAQRGLNEAQNALSAVRGEMRPLGDLAALNAQVSMLSERIDCLTMQSDAIQAAAAALLDAENEMQQRFAPALSKLTGEIFSSITGGRYEKALVGRSFEPVVSRRGQVGTLTPLQLSRGAADQLYFALRLAVCTLTLSGESPPPLILDDALAAFDDTRMAYALDYLRSEAKNRQILLFSCHSREAQRLSGINDVNVVRLTAL